MMNNFILRQLKDDLWDQLRFVFPQHYFNIRLKVKNNAGPSYLLVLMVLEKYTKEIKKLFEFDVEMRLEETECLGKAFQFFKDKIESMSNAN